MCIPFSFSSIIITTNVFGLHSVFNANLKLAFAYYVFYTNLIKFVMIIIEGYINFIVFVIKINDQK